MKTGGILKLKLKQKGKEMISIIILVLQLTFSNGYLQPYPLPTGDSGFPRLPFPFQDAYPNGF